MARQARKDGDGGARIRLIVLEADLPDGDVGQLAQALQNALRPAPVLMRQAQAASRPQIEAAIVEPEQADEDDLSDESTVTPGVKRISREGRARRITVPTAVELDSAAVESWKAFAGSKDPKSEIDRYLVVAAWFYDHRDKAPIGTGHIYACYRYMKWPSGIGDFGSHLRAAKKQQFLNSVSRGEYVITQLGLQKVADLPN